MVIALGKKGLKGKGFRAIRELRSCLDSQYKGEYWGNGIARGSGAGLAQS